MSREIDPNKKNLTEDEKKYLAQRGLLPTSVMSTEEQRQLLDPENDALSLEERANTGTVNTANLTVEQLEEELERRRAEAEEQRVKHESETDDEDEEDDSEEEADYSSWNKAQLQAEIDSRNEGRADDAKIAPASDKNKDLVAALEEDDASEDEEE